MKKSPKTLLKPERDNGTLKRKVTGRFGQADVSTSPDKNFDGSFSLAQKTLVSTGNNDSSKNLFKMNRTDSSIDTIPASHTPVLAGNPFEQTVTSISHFNQSKQDDFALVKQSLEQFKLEKSPKKSEFKRYISPQPADLTMTIQIVDKQKLKGAMGNLGKQSLTARNTSLVGSDTMSLKTTSAISQPTLLKKKKTIKKKQNATMLSSFGQSQKSEKSLTDRQSLPNQSRNGVFKNEMLITDKTQIIQKNPSIIKQLVALKALKGKPSKTGKESGKVQKPSVIKKEKKDGGLVRMKSVKMKIGEMNHQSSIDSIWMVKSPDKPVGKSFGLEMGKQDQAQSMLEQSPHLQEVLLQRSPIPKSQISDDIYSQQSDDQVILEENLELPAAVDVPDEVEEEVEKLDESDDTIKADEAIDALEDGEVNGEVSGDQRVDEVSKDGETEVFTKDSGNEVESLDGSDKVSDIIQEKPKLESIKVKPDLEDDDELKLGLQPSLESPASPTFDLNGNSSKSGRKPPQRKASSNKALSVSMYFQSEIIEEVKSEQYEDDHHEIQIQPENGEQSPNVQKESLIEIGEEEEEKYEPLGYTEACYSNPNVEFFVYSPSEKFGSSDRYNSDQKMQKIMEDDMQSAQELSSSDCDLPNTNSITPDAINTQDQKSNSAFKLQEDEAKKVLTKNKTVGDLEVWATPLDQEEKSRQESPLKLRTVPLLALGSAVNKETNSNLSKSDVDSERARKLKLALSEKMLTFQLDSKGSEARVRQTTSWIKDSIASSGSGGRSGGNPKRMNNSQGKYFAPVKCVFVDVVRQASPAQRQVMDQDLLAAEKNMLRRFAIEERKDKSKIVKDLTITITSNEFDSAGAQTSKPMSSPCGKEDKEEDLGKDKKLKIARENLKFIKSELHRDKLEKQNNQKKTNTPQSAGFLSKGLFKLGQAQKDPAEDLALINFDDAMLSQPSFQTLLHLTAMRFKDLKADQLQGKRAICDILRRHREDSQQRIIQLNSQLNIRTQYSSNSPLRSPRRFTANQSQIGLTYGSPLNQNLSMRLRSPDEDSPSNQKAFNLGNLYQPQFGDQTSQGPNSTCKSDFNKRIFDTEKM